MATKTPVDPRDNLHGEEEKEPLFGPNSDDPSKTILDKPTFRGDDPGEDALSRYNGGKSAGSHELNSAEESGGTGKTGRVGSDESSLSDQVGKGFNPTSEATHLLANSTLAGKALSVLAAGLALLRRNKKKSVTSGVAIGLVSGLILIGGIVQGPLKFVHLGEMLQKFHFTTNYDETDDRFSRLGRYVYHKSGDEVYKTNLGYFQNKYADRVAEKMKASGIDTAYHPRLGFAEKYVIDPKKLANTEFGSLENADAQDVKKHIEAKFPKTNVTIDKGLVFIDFKDNNFRNQALTRHLLQISGYSKVLTAVNGRVMSKRANFVLHPFKKLDRTAQTKFLEAYDKWKGDREKIIKGEEIPLRTANGEGGDDDDTDQEKADKKAQAEQPKSEADKALSEIKAGNGLKALSGAAAIAGIGCLAKSIDENYDNTKQSQVIEPSIRMALDAISVGSQVKAGDDFSVEQLEFMERQLYGEDASGKKSGYNQAKSINGELGKKNSGVEESETLKTIDKGSPFSALNSGAAGSALDAVCSTPGQIAQITVSFIAGPITTVAMAPVSAVLGPILEDELVKHLSGEPIDPLAAGADYGNIVNYGGRLAANSQAIGNGGRALDDSEENQLALMESSRDQEEFQSRSFASRMFDTRDYRSFASRLIDAQEPGLNQNIASIAKNFSSVNTWISNLSSIFTKQASAAPKAYDYGFPQYGFSPGEMSSQDVENPYINAEDVVTRILPDNPDFIEKAKKCFGVDIDPSTYNAVPSLDTSPTYKDIEDNGCGDNSKDWMKVRFYIFDNQIATSASCYEGDDEACSSLGMGDASVSANESSEATSTAGAEVDIQNIREPSNSIACAENTKDVGVHDGYTQGKKVKIRVCAVSNITSTSEESNNGFGVSGANGKLVVNSRVSGAVYAMVEAAKKDGVKLSAASGFRTMAHQQSLCPCDGVSVAVPGTSNHQLGVAVDFGEGGVLISSGSKMWRWLDKNADRFSFKPYAVEPWHWSPLEN